MGHLIDLIGKLREAIAPVEPPAGVKAPPKVIIDEDSDAMQAAWLLYGVDDAKAKSEQLLHFVRGLESAAEKAVPGLVVYVKFAPVSRKRGVPARTAKVSGGAT